MIFALQYAQAAPPDPEVADTTYDPEMQMLVLGDGTPAVRDRQLLLVSGTTTSTAGSKTHFDD